MHKSRIVFFFAVLAIVVGIAKCNSQKQAQMIGVSATPTPTWTPLAAATPTPQPSPSAVAAASVAPTPPPDFKKAANHVVPSVIAVSVFDASGKLLRTGTGFFVSDDGRFVTSRSVVQGAANAVAKTSDGGIYDVPGLLAEGAPADVAVLKAQVKDKVSFLSFTEGAADRDKGKSVAIIGNPESPGASKITEAKISAVRKDPNGDWLELPALATELLGAPVVDEQGDVIGIVVLQRGAGTAANVVRVAAAIDPILTKIEARAKPAWVVESPQPPALGPTKIPLAGASPNSKSRLIFSPPPNYPTAARHSYFPAKGAGRFAVRFGPDGLVKDVEVIQSTRNSTLDQAAVDTLRRWKAQPGKEWTATVPITFQP